VNYTLKKLSEIFNVDFIGEKNYIIDRVSSFENATDTSVVFLSDKKFLKFLDKTKAKVIITTKSLSEFCNVNMIISENPYLLFAKISQLINKKDVLVYGIHNSVVSSTNNLNSKILVQPNVVIGEQVKLGDNIFIGANSYIGDSVKIGDNAYIYPNVTIYGNVQIGSNIVIHSGSVIGSDGFGYVNESGVWVKIPQIGGVQIGDNVEIGSNTSIDRGALDNTIIGNGVKIDNQIQIAHNVHIGDNTAIAGCVGIAGSAKIGKNCTIGGGAGIQGHVEICDNTQITGMTKVSCNIKEAGVYSSGTPLMLNKKWLKNAARFKQLNELFLKYKKK
tara:strand:- start:4435 stop:5430 length:996 start_codon:yes stop_codon:yes gene_type:complete